MLMGLRTEGGDSSTVVGKDTKGANVASGKGCSHGSNKESSSGRDAQRAQSWRDSVHRVVIIFLMRHGSGRREEDSRR